MKRDGVINKEKKDLEGGATVTQAHGLKHDLEELSGET